MKTGRTVRFLATGAAGLLIFCLLTVLFIPASALLQAANGALSRYGLQLGAVSFGKILPLGISGRGITLSSGDGELLKLDRGRISLEMLPLLAGRVSVAVSAEIGSGRLTSVLSLNRAPSSRIELKNIRLEEIPFFRNVAGMKASGILSGKAETTGLLARAKGYLQLEVKGVELSGMKLGEMPLPDAGYRTVQGMVRINDGKAAIESFTLEGDDLYARLKGGLPLVDPLPMTPLDISLELMPKPALLERQKLIFLLLVKFQDTPGHYLIPVKGTLGKPQAL